jgi:hypothetical protein
MSVQSIPFDEIHHAVPDERGALWPTEVLHISHVFGGETPLVPLRDVEKFDVTFEGFDKSFLQFDCAVEGSIVHPNGISSKIVSSKHIGDGDDGVRYGQSGDSYPIGVGGNRGIDAIPRSGWVHEPVVREKNPEQSYKEKQHVASSDAALFCTTIIRRKPLAFCLL